MRLIDADELKKAFIDEWNYEADYAIFRQVENIIDNAPTVPYFTNEQCENAYDEGYEFGIKTQRPQGEWEWVQYDANPNIGNWHCSICHNICYEMKLAHDNYNYCPNCGASMRGNNNG